MDEAISGEPPHSEALAVSIPSSARGVRLDRALADHAPAVAGAKLSRARIQDLISRGAVVRNGSPVTDASARIQGEGIYTILAPPPDAATPAPQALPLTVLFEDRHLIVVDKAPGMAAHPAPGTPDGTLVNALLHHCGPDLSGVGGVLRPGIVHRLDKDTSGVMVAAKTDAAHQGLSALFAAHDIQREYVALVRGAPNPEQGTISTQLGRARFDRQRMAVLKEGGRAAITSYRVAARYVPDQRPGTSAVAARIVCRLETGRTHQIRVHLAYKGAPVLGDPLYGSSPPTTGVRAAIEAAGLTRQALHATLLGFVHPVSGELLRFEQQPPPDMMRLESELQSRFFSS